MLATFVESTPAHARRRGLALASVGAHIALGIGLFGYSILHIEEIAPPAISLTFFSAPPPPPPPPPPAGHKAKTTPTKPTPTPTVKIIAPTEVKKEEPKDEDDGEEGGVLGGVKGGVVGGVVGGVLGGTGVAPKMVASFTLAAQQVAHADPKLPDWFLNQHAQQTVKGIYKVCIRQDGGISDVTPMTAIGGVDDLVMDQIKANWLYKPQPVPVCTASVIIFRIK